MFSVSRELVEDLLIINVDEYEYTGRWINEVKYFIIKPEFLSYLVSICRLATLRTVEAFDTCIIGVEESEINNLQHEFTDFKSRSGVRFGDDSPTVGSTVHSSL